MRNLFIIILSIWFFSCSSKTNSSEFTEEDKKEIIDREVKTWEYSKTKELNKLKEILADDYTGYFGKKTMTQQDVISSLEKATVRSYELINVKVKPVTKDVAIIYYLANQNGVS